MIEIDFEFATKDDCLQEMVPSDLRGIISERDRLREEKAELLEAAENLVALNLVEIIDSDPTSDDAHDRERVCAVQNLLEAIAKAKGEQG